MTVHLKPETQARLAAEAAASGMSVDAYLEELVQKQFPPAPAEPEPVAGSTFRKEHGIWVYRTGEPMPLTLVDETLDALRREREAGFLGNTPR